MQYELTHRDLPVERIDIPNDAPDPDRHDVEKVAMMRASMRDDGKPLVPILVDRQWVVIDGQRRLRLARELGHAQIPALIVHAERRDLTDLELYELRHRAHAQATQMTVFGLAQLARQLHEARGPLSPGLTATQAEIAKEHHSSTASLQRADAINQAAASHDPAVREDALNRKAAVEAGAPLRQAMEGNQACGELSSRDENYPQAHETEPKSQEPDRGHESEQSRPPAELRAVQAAEIALVGLVQHGAHLQTLDQAYRLEALRIRTDEAVGVLRELVQVLAEDLAVHDAASIIEVAA